MYKDPYLKPSQKYQQDIKKIDEKIDEEYKKENIDTHRIMKLEEQKLIQQLFSNEINGTFSKFCSPW